MGGLRTGLLISIGAIVGSAVSALSSLAIAADRETSSAESTSSILPPSAASATGRIGAPAFTDALNGAVLSTASPAAVASPSLADLLNAGAAPPPASAELPVPNDVADAAPALAQEVVPQEPPPQEATASGGQIEILLPQSETADAPPAAITAAPAAVQQASQTVRLNPSGRDFTIVAPLKDGGAFLGEVEVRIRADDTVEVAVSQVFELLSPLVEAAALEPLRPLAEPGIFAPLQTFADAGAPLAFDPRTLELSVTLPSSARGRQTIGLADIDRELYGDFAQPESFTAYLNMRGSVDYRHDGFGETGFGDPFILLDGAARLGGVVLESEGAWNGDGGFSRNGTRLVYDDARHLNRWTAGDLLVESRGFQGVSDIAGIGVNRTYALLDPQRNVAPRGGRTFTLERDATVEAVVNGRSVRIIRLRPGTYDVSDFPFVQGSNDVDLIIVDDAGQREVISFSLFIDRTQLAPGLSEFGFYGGVISQRSGSGIDYSDDYAVSGFYRRGMSENLTLGTNFQVAEAGRMAGLETVWGAGWGTVGADAAFSDLDGVGTGWAINGSFERLVQTEGGGLSLTAAFEARSRRFGSIGQVAVNNPYAFNASLAVNRSFGDSSFAGAQIRYAHGRDETEDETSLRLTYGRRLSGTMNAIVDLDWSEGGFAEGVGVRVALVRRFGSTGSARAEYDSRSERGRLGYQTSGGRGVGAWSAASNLDLGSDIVGLNASGSYAANRMDLGFAHTTAYSQTTDDISDQRTSLRAGAAIAFADGGFAIGRPVSDGFVIVRPYSGAPRLNIEVEPSPEGYYARSGLLGPALYGQVSAYSPRSVTFDAPDAPPGFDIGQGAVRILPPYRAGYVAVVGSEYGVTAIGRMLDANGQPLSLLAGYAVEQGGEGRRVDMFTNRQGAFGIGGLKAGRWRIEMPGDPVLIYILDIPESPEGVARVGELRPQQGGE